MAVGMDRGELLHPVEVDLLCAFADVVAPIPLEVPSTGVTEVERLVMFSGAREMLTERGLADEAGPLGVADDFVYLLRNATGVLDLLLSEEKPRLAAVVMCYRTEALLITQDFAEPEQMIRMKAVTLDEAIDDLARIVPRVDGAASAPFSLPRKALQDAYAVMLKRIPPTPELLDDDESDVDGPPAELHVPNPMQTDEIDELLATHGIDERVARKMVSHLQPVLGSGLTGVAKRDNSEDQWHRAGEELRWVDTPRGRFRLAEDGGWISVNPLGFDEIRSTFRRFAGSIRG